MSMQSTNKRCPKVQIIEEDSISVQNSSQLNSPGTTTDDSKVVRFEVSPKTILEGADDEPQPDEAESTNDSVAERRGRLRGRRKGTRAKRSPTPFVRRTHSNASGESDSERVTSELDTPKSSTADPDMPFATVTTPSSNRARNLRMFRASAEPESGEVDSPTNKTKKDAVSSSRNQVGRSKISSDNIANDI